MGLGTNLFGKYETTPGTSGWGPVADGDVYGRNLKRQNWDDRGQRFLKGFIGNNKNRGGATAAAASGSKAKETEKKVQNQFNQMGDDITIEKGYRDPGYTIAGTPGKKGLVGSLVKGAANVFMPGVGGAITSAVVGDRLDHL